MSAKKHTFPEERFGPKLLAFVKSHNKARATRYGPDIVGLKLKGRGLNWVIVGTHWSGFTARDTDTAGEFDGLQGRYQWQGKFIDAETDFDL